MDRGSCSLALAHPARSGPRVSKFEPCCLLGLNVLKLPKGSPSFLIQNKVTVCREQGSFYSAARSPTLRWKSGPAPPLWLQHQGKDTCGCCACPASCCLGLCLWFGCSLFMFTLWKITISPLTEQNNSGANSQTTHCTFRWFGPSGSLSDTVLR